MRENDRVIAAIWRDGQGPLRFLPTVLFRDDRPVRAILIGWLLTITGSVAIGLLLQPLVPGGVGPELGKAPALTLFVALTLVSPVLETLIMASVLAILLRWMRPWVAVIVSAVGWGIAHSMLSALWGAVIWWPFLIFSTVFVTWRPTGFWRAAAVACAIHILQNTGPALAITLGS